MIEVRRTGGKRGSETCGGDVWRRRAERDEGRAGGRRGAPRRVAAVALLAEGEVDVAAVGALPVARRRPRPRALLHHGHALLHEVAGRPAPGETIAPGCRFLQISKLKL